MTARKRLRHQCQEVVSHDGRRWGERTSCIHNNLLRLSGAVDTIILMNITFDPAKRAKTLEERGLDFADADQVFASVAYTIEDDRLPYPEPRFITFGMLAERLVMVVWTPMPDGRRIISMRKANDREQARYRDRVG